jgi:UDP-N-acetylmuramoylalanine--D-glutamate ligase
MDLTAKNIAIVGMGRTGLATARFCLRRGATVRVSDAGSPETLADAVRQLTALGVAVELGPHRADAFRGAELIVVSPGVPHGIAPLADARLRGIPVWGEIEMASRFIEAPLVAVTGTNGKTTTTTLLGEMLRRSGLTPFVGGNIGRPLIEYVDTEPAADVVVCEVSSFQLDTIEAFHPRVAVLLNIAEDHLDRYDDLQAYAASKGRIFENQNGSDSAVYNADDPRVAALAAGAGSTRLPFHCRRRPELRIDSGAHVVGDRLLLYPRQGEALRLDLARFKPPGGHNRENATAAALAALAAGATPEGVQAALDAFVGLPHRLEWVAAVDGVDYFNDSKATNPDAVQRALESVPQPVVLILGGRDKGADLGVLREAVAGRVRGIVALGENRKRIAGLFGALVPVTPAFSMAEAVAAARETAVRGDTVLLSPACASFDLYVDYAQRGEAFRRAVAGLRAHAS